MLYIEYIYYIISFGEWRNPKCGNPEKSEKQPVSGKEKLIDIYNPVSHM